MIAQKYLDEFRYFGNRVYLDCSAMGMPPQRTRDFAKHYLDIFADSLGREPDIQGELIRPKAKAAIAELIHADPADIFFTKNTTEGNNLLAPGYPLHSGDEVLVCNEDFPAVYMPWTTLQRDGIILRVVRGDLGVVSADDLIAEMTDRTRVVAVSMAQSSSGYVTDLVKLGNACHERGILLSVDAVQAAGRLPIDVEKMNIDVLASASFKGLLGIMGAGFCWCRPSVMNETVPTVLSGNIDWDDYPMEPGFQSLPVPEFPPRAARMETGTTNNLGIGMMAESIAMLNEIGIETIAEHIRSLETRYRECLRESGLPVRMLGTEDPETWSGSVSFLYDQDRKQVLSDALRDAEIFASVRSYFRVSFHYYNTLSHVDRLMSVLQAALG